MHFSTKLIILAASLWFDSSLTAPLTAPLNQDNGGLWIKASPALTNMALEERGLFDSYRSWYKHPKGHDGEEFQCEAGWPHDEKSYVPWIGIPAHPSAPEPPTGVPTDENGKIIHEPLDQFGKEKAGRMPKKDQCCRITSACYDLYAVDLRDWDTLWNTDRVAFKQHMCCTKDYLFSCPHPQDPKLIWFNRPPLCSNPW